MNFSNLLIDWYLHNKRSLPWRNTQDPYYIWLSEIILQQTRVAQGKPYFDAFLTHFPTVYDLANASEEEVLKLWQGLGYYSRARNLHATSKYIAAELEGVFPKNYADLLQLKGVGEYTAAAIASFAYNEPVAVVDGNVFRVLARVYGIFSDISIAKTKKEFQELAQKLLAKKEAATFNQAIMDFGALQCVPNKPDCLNCVFNVKCIAFKKDLVATLPVKLKKTVVKNRYFNYLIIIDSNGNFLVRKRAEKGIWFNLYEFTLLEFETKQFINKVVSESKDKFKCDKIVLKNEQEIVHKLSHQHLHIRFFEVQLDYVLKEAITLEKLKKLPVPIVIHNFLETNYF